MFSQRSANIPAAVILILLAAGHPIPASSADRLRRSGDQGKWGVSYTRGGVCALKGSSVDFSCSYKHPEGLTVNRSLWFIASLWKAGVEPKDVSESGQYRGRVRYSRTPNNCTLTITGLRETDTQTYKFRFLTNDPADRYTGEPGVSLTITDLKVTVLHTDGGVKTLNCTSTCSLPSNSTYIWSRNGQCLPDCESASCSVGVVSEADTYNCTVKGRELCSPPVDSQPLQGQGTTVVKTPTQASLEVIARTSAYTAAGVIVVLLLVFSGGFLWMRRRGAGSSSRSEEDSGEVSVNEGVQFDSSPNCALNTNTDVCWGCSRRAAGPVYDDVSTQVVTSERPEAGPSDDLDDVQYSTVRFTRSPMKEVPHYPSVQPTAAPQEEEVQYAAVNTATSRRAQ
ncbi:hypothetical protein NFI96_008816 [Prochilodus magdalenae]|nr:hypothetical protein NFI96_008816 [Prochilodus magdalenae]